MSRIKIAPSLLSADFANLARDVQVLENAGADILHLDVMDGHFVPNITFGPAIVKALRPHTSMPFDCHLMIRNPDHYIAAFAEAGADWISVHVEEVQHLHRTLSFIRSFGKRAGIVLNPLTPIDFAFEAAEYSDFILLMSVNPGFGGQAFISNLYRRASELREFLVMINRAEVDIEVDGGINDSNIFKAAEAGANIFVSGSGVFRGDIATNVSTLRKLANDGFTREPY